MSAVKRRKQKLGAGDRAFNIVLGGLTAVSVVVILYPLIFVLVASISDPMEIFQGKWNAWVLFELGRNERMRFGQLKKAIPGYADPSMTAAFFMAFSICLS